MAVSIVKLIKQDMKYSSIICKWFYEWWGEDEGFTMEKMEAYVSNSICQDRIPQTHVLLEGKTIIGVYQLSVTDIDVRPDIYPWLINVYIDYPYRGKGYFKLLMGFSKGELPAPRNRTKHVGLYEKYGWQFVEEFHTFIKGKEVQRLYSWDLSHYPKN